MEDIMLCLLFFLSTIFLGLMISTKFLIKERNQHYNLPPSPLALPIIGHFHLLKPPINRSLNSLSQKYGPIISLRFGSRLAIVVSSLSAVQECFTKNDIIFANRPHVMSSKYLHYNDSTMGTADYGDHWRHLRRISAIEIFSSARLNAFIGIRKDEVKRLLTRLYRASNHGFAKVELRPMLFDLTTNVMMRMVAGKRYYGEDAEDNEKAREFRLAMEDFFRFSTGANAGDFIPILQWFDFSGYEKKLVKLGRKMDFLFQQLIDEHRADGDRNTMINHLLTLQESNPEYYTDEIIKGQIMMMLLAGSESSALSVEWALSNLLNHPNVLMKAKAELDTLVGEDKLIDEPDFPKLHYLQSIITENMRLYPVAPILVPHMSSADCSIGGYDVPAKTMLFVNAWAMHRDPKLWDDPTSFKPERFHEQGKRLELAYKLIPFGMGRRACPGDGLAKRVVALALGSLIQSFEWERIGGKEIDMTEKTTISLSKLEPLKVMCKARPILNTLLSN